MLTLGHPFAVQLVLVLVPVAVCCGLSSILRVEVLVGVALAVFGSLVVAVVEVEADGETREVPLRRVHLSNGHSRFLLLFLEMMHPLGEIVRETALHFLVQMMP